LRLRSSGQYVHICTLRHICVIPRHHADACAQITARPAPALDVPQLGSSPFAACSRRP
jgi:hypothetical protein